jgi:cytochrome c551/c552
MKKVLLIALAISLVATGVAFAGVVGSMHDLGTSGAASDPTNTGTGQVCVFCHHPHRGKVTFAGSPLANAILWNITDWSPTVFPVYDANESGSFNATGSGDLYNDGSAATYASFFCMACHDGAIGPNALVRPPRDGTQTSSWSLPDASDLGDTLEDDHPVNFSVTAALVSQDGELKALVWQSTRLSDSYPIFSSKMQCATCHDVHRGTLGSEATCSSVSGNSCDNTIEFMLGDTTNSGICTDCHIK